MAQPHAAIRNEMTNGIVLSVLSAVAQQERITLSERTKAGVQYAFRTGRCEGGAYLEGDHLTTRYEYTNVTAPKVSP